MTKKLFYFVAALLLDCNIVSSQDLIGTWRGMLNAGGQKLEIIFHFDKGSDGVSTAKMDVPAQGAKGIPANLSLLTTDSVSLDIKAINMAYSAKLSDGILRGTFKQFGMSFPLNMKPGGPDAVNRPQVPIGPFIYNTEEVSFRNNSADIMLSGTLTYPVGYINIMKPSVVIMVTGSGAQNRDEEVFGHKPFLVIADYLARHGIASLRYDDRGVGKSTGTQAGCTSRDFADDAKCGLKWLRDSGKFGKIGILGHSEGGAIAFMVGTEANLADFIVSMAGPGIKGDTLLVEQQKAILKLKGIPQPNLTVEELRKEMAKQPKNVWLDYFIDYDPEEDLKKLTVPVMAVNGSNDLQVISKTNLARIQEILSGKNKKNFFKEYPNLNHLFQNCEPDSAIDYYNIEETCSEEVLHDISTWINSL